MEIKKEIVLDLLETQNPALSSTSDMPVVETKPDSVAAAPEPEEVEEQEQPGESATPATETEQTGEPAKKESRGVQKALDRLTAERETERRRADQEHEEKLRLLKLLEERGKPEPVEEPVVDDAPVRPSREDFPDPDAWDAAFMAYAEDKAEWSAKRELEKYIAESKKQQELQAIEEGQRTVREAFAARVEKAQEKYPDFKEVTENSEVQVSMAMVHAITHSPQGPELQYHLAKHPEEAKRLMSLTPPEQLLELGMALAKLSSPATRPVSAAPPPIKPVKAGTETMAKDPDEMSMEEYKAFRGYTDRAARH